VVGETPHVAGLVAFVGALTEHERLTVPVNELAGVTEIVEVLPEVEPGLKDRLMGLLESEKLLPVLGASQKPLHPARSGSAARKIPAHLAYPILARFITSPWGRIVARTHPSRLPLLKPMTIHSPLLSGTAFATRSAQNTIRRPTTQGYRPALVGVARGACSAPITLDAGRFAVARGI